MTPDAAILALDAQLAENGQTVTIRRPRDGSTASVTLRAKIRDYRPDELIGALRQGDTKAIVSATGLESWPDKRVKSGDWIEIDGVNRSIVAPAPVKINDVLVRVDLQVR